MCIRLCSVILKSRIIYYDNSVSTILCKLICKITYTASKKYWVGQVRSEEALAYDAYRFEDLPGSSENEDVAATVGGVTVKMSQYGNGQTLTKAVRLDLPFAAGIVDHRSCATVYILKA